MEDQEKKKKTLKIEEGNGENLHISEAYDYIEPEKPRASIDKPKNVIIPKEHIANKKRTDKSKKI